MQNQPTTATQQQEKPSTGTNAAQGPTYPAATETSAAPTSSAAPGTHGTGSTVGRKIKGAVGVVHGVGENIRGSAMNFVDTIADTGPERSEEIASRGRLETQQGMAEIRGGRLSGTSSAPSTTGKGGPSAAHPVAPGHIEPGNQFPARNDAAAPPVPPRDHQYTYYPKHHRDDAVTDAHP